MQGKINKIKLTMLAMLGAALMAGGVVQGQTNINYSFPVNALVPDGSPIGLVSTKSVAGLNGYISSVQVNLDITGGFNGDLYAYLTGPQGGFAVLLNRVGMSSSNSFGYSDAGFNITLTDGGNDIHHYQDYVIPGGQLTGATWAPDGRNISPGAAPSLFDATGTSDFSVYNNSLPNGDWTLFIADLSGGGQSTLVSWGLTIVTVPEPQTWMLGVGGGLGLLLALRRRRNR